MRRRVSLCFLAVALVTAIPVASPADQHPDPCAIQYEHELTTSRRESNVTVPSERFPTLQAAVCGVASNGTVFVLPGIYEEEIVVRGKRVQIIGRGDIARPETWPQLRAMTPTEPIARELARGTITIEDAGSVTVRGLAFVGGDAQIKLVDQATGLDVTNVRFEGGWDGVLNLSPVASVTVRHSDFFDQIDTGLSYIPPLVNEGCQKKVNVSHAFFGEQRGVGVLIKNCRPSDVSVGEAFVLGLVMHNLNLEGQGRGGLLIQNSGPFTLNNITIRNARTFGIAAFGSEVTLENSKIEDTASTPDNQFGDGVVIAPIGSAPTGKQSSLTMRNVDILRSARAGHFNFGSASSLAGVVINGAAFALAAKTQDGFAYSFEDAAKNWCSDTFATFSLGECRTVTAEGPAPIPR